jgi:uncharacterized protein
MKYFVPLAGALLACSAVAADYQVGDRLSPNGQDTGAHRYQEVSWDDLLPQGWDPMKAIEGLKLDQLSDDDPRAEAAAKKIREMWNDAPSNPAIDGKAIRIAGFMVPLELGKKEVTEFLLVPYFGACIHVPPPPANQIIDVHTTQPYKTESFMEAVWVAGIIERAETKGDMADVGYRLKAEHVERYRPPSAGEEGSAKDPKLEPESSREEAQSKEP